MNPLNRPNYLKSVSRHPLTFIIGAAAVACLGLLVASPARSDSYWWPHPKALAAFSLKIKVTEYERRAGGEVMKVETQAQRSDGATVVVDALYFPGAPRTIRMIRLPDGTRINLVDALSSKTTCRPKRREAAPVRETLLGPPKPPDCLGPLDKLLGRTTLFGQPVNIVKTWDRGSAGQRWVAPALGCLELQWQSASFQPDGPRKVRLEGKLVSFTLGEPDARLFDRGARYDEVKPSELLRRGMKAAGVNWGLRLAAEGVKKDQEYAAACETPATLLQ